MDIKTQLLIPLEDIFPPRPPGDRPVTYTAIASNSFQTDKGAAKAIAGAFI